MCWTQGGVGDLGCFGVGRKALEYAQYMFQCFRILTELPRSLNICSLGNFINLPYSSVNRIEIDTSTQAPQISGTSKLNPAGCAYRYPYRFCF